MALSLPCGDCDVPEPSAVDRGTEGSSSAGMSPCQASSGALLARALCSERSGRSAASTVSTESEVPRIPSSSRSCVPPLAIPRDEGMSPGHPSPSPSGKGKGRPLPEGSASDGRGLCPAGFFSAERLPRGVPGGLSPESGVVLRDPAPLNPGGVEGGSCHDSDPTNTTLVWLLALRESGAQSATSAELGTGASLQSANGPADLRS
mmetsp:Transcript_10862/g.25802  ORF Transcript_10862/g.25802 Transcript_10862/m.25802 type:complete len:205 (+) Transcript_10862:954-1568(+)